MYACFIFCMWACIRVDMFVVFLPVCVCVEINIYIYTHISDIFMSMHMYVCLCMYVCMYVCMYICIYIYIYVVQRRPPPSHPMASPHTPPPPPIMLPEPPRWCGWWGCLRGLFKPPLFLVVWWVSGLVFNAFPPPRGVVVGVGFRVCLHPHPPLWCAWCLGFTCIDMTGFRVEGQQLGAAQTETMAHPGACRHVDEVALLQKSQHSRGSRARGAHPCDCWRF